MSARLSAGTTHGPRWFLPQAPELHQGRPCHYFWQIQWTVSATTGYIIQEVYTEVHQQQCYAVAASPVLWTRYWEAWAVTALNEIENGGHDVWTIQLGQATRGWWVKRGVAYWAAALDNPGTWSRTAVPDTNGLLGRRTPPANLGPPLCRREARGEWRACGPVAANNFHRAIPRGHAGTIPALLGATDSAS
jgi:hypothetical protein